MAELVDAHGSGPCEHFALRSSTLLLGTIPQKFPLLNPRTFFEIIFVRFASKTCPENFKKDSGVLAHFGSNGFLMGLRLGTDGKIEFTC